MDIILREYTLKDNQIYEKIYKQTFANADVVDLTFVHHTFEGNAFFSEIDLKIWKETARQDCKADAKNKYAYSFMRFERAYP
jgi:dihydrofolate reductase